MVPPHPPPPRPGWAGRAARRCSGSGGAGAGCPGPCVPGSPSQRAAKREIRRGEGQRVVLEQGFCMEGEVKSTRPHQIQIQSQTETTASMLLHTLIPPTSLPDDTKYLAGWSYQEPLFMAAAVTGLRPGACTQWRSVQAHACNLHKQDAYPQESGCWAAATPLLFPIPHSHRQNSCPWCNSNTKNKQLAFGGSIHPLAGVHVGFLYKPCVVKLHFLLLGGHPVNRACRPHHLHAVPWLLCST